MAELSFDAVQDYITSLVPPREAEMREMEKYADKTNFPIIGPAGGYYCYQIARMIGARSIFEMGSGYGYSTAWFAKAVLENGGGVVHHTVWDEKPSKMAANHLSRLGFNGLIRYHVAEAVETLRQTDGQLDLIFNDIDKEAYPESLPLIKSKLRRGGVLVIDNMLWHGQILNPNDHAKSTEAIRDFTKTITTDKDWIASLVPVRDGMIIAYKK